MTLCPTCNNTLQSKHDDLLGEPLIFCSVCKRYTVEGCGVWVAPSLCLAVTMKRLIKQRNDDKARFELMMTSDINDPIWTKLSP